MILWGDFMDYQKRLFLKSAVIGIGLLAFGVSFDSLSFAERVTKENYLYKKEVLDDKYPLVLSHIRVDERVREREMLPLSCSINYNGKTYIVDERHNAELTIGKGVVFVKAPEGAVFYVKNVPNLSVKVDDTLFYFTGDTAILDRNNVKKTFNSNEVKFIVYDYLNRVLRYRKIGSEDLIQESF